MLHNNDWTITADKTGEEAAKSAPVAGSQLAQGILMDPDILPGVPPAGALRAPPTALRSALQG